MKEISLLKREKELQTKLLGEAKEEISQLKREKEEISLLKREKELQTKLLGEAKEEISQLKREKEEISLLKREKELQTKLLGEAKEEISQLKREKEEISLLKREKELQLKSDLNAMKATHDKTNQELKLKLKAVESDLFEACKRIDELEREKKKKQEEKELLNKELLKNLDEKNDKEVKGEGEEKAKKNDKEVNGEKEEEDKGVEKADKKPSKKKGGGGKGEKEDKAKKEDKKKGGGGKGEEEDKAKKEPFGKKGGKGKGKEEEGGKGQSSGKGKEEVEIKNFNSQILMDLKNLKKVEELWLDLDAGFNMIVKVMQVSVTREKAPQIAEGRIGDNTGVVNFKVIGNKNVKQMKERLGSFVKLINVRIELVDKRMRIQPAEIEQFETSGWEPEIMEENDLSGLELKEV